MSASKKEKGGKWPLGKRNRRFVNVLVILLSQEWLGLEKENITDIYFLLF